MFKPAAWLRVMVVMIFLGCLSGANPLSAQGQGKRSEHFLYSGYSSAQYKGHTKQTLYVSLPGGAKLAVDVFLPSDGPGAGPFPVAFSFTAYGRASVDLKTGKISDSAATPLGQLLLSHGYAVVSADMSGTGASFGTQTPFLPKIGEEGKELVDWIAAQRWCDGNVGMFGQSYLGWIQLATARNKPRALKCIIPEVILFEDYTEGFRPGGVEAVNWIRNYSLYLQGRNLNVYRPEFGLLPTAPVLDEDGDGDLADEIPLMDKGNPTTFLDDGLPPRYADGGRRSQNAYFMATMGHAANPTFEKLAAAAPYFDSTPAGSLTFATASPGAWIPEIVKSGIPVYNLGGWFDGFCKGTLKLYATMQGRTTEKLLVAPRFHMPWVTPAYKEYFGYPEDLGQQLNIERLRFFDRYLKGIRNGIETEPPVYLYVMNSGWRAERDWPLARQVVTNFYFGEKGGLSRASGAGGSDEYRVDFSHSSLYGGNKSNRWYMMAPPDELMVRTDKDKQCLVYETEPLAQDVEVTGHPIADLWVTSNRKDGDLFVYLVDVDESGKALHVTEGGLRSGWQAAYPDDDQVNGVVDVRPDLPWHGYKKEQWKSGGLDPVKPANLKFDLYPTSWVFRKGHRIRVSVAGADYPSMGLNPGLAPQGKPEECPETRITVHRTKDFPSRVELPIIPKK